MKLTKEQLIKIENTLNDGHRVELIPLKNEIKVLKVERKQIK